MISVEVAHQMIIETALTAPAEKQNVILQNAVGMVLRENIYADRDLPPYNRVAMDGIAFNTKAFLKNGNTFTIEKTIAAGDSTYTLQNQNACVEIMTGAVLPIGANAVVRYEDLKIENNKAELLVATVNELQNIHTKGKDINAQSILIEEGVQLSTAEIAICASVGKAQILVSKLPKVAIISTGNELVEVDKPVLPHQIRKSNTYMIDAQLQQWNIKATAFHLNDDLEEIKNQLKNILQDYDVVLITGGVSKGKFDYLPQALDELGVQKRFHKIAQRPGKPFWFGSNNNTVVFALPGNPVSTFVCLLRYFKAWLQNYLQQKDSNSVYFALEEDVNFKPDLTYFVPVKLVNRNVRDQVAKPFAGNGSGDFVNLKNVDGFLELPKGKDIYNKGEFFKFINFRR